MEQPETPIGTVSEEARPSIQERLLETRTVMIFGEINQKMAEKVTQQLLLLSALSDEDIKVVINSQGGHVESGDTIFDMIRFVKPTVKVIGTASRTALLAAQYALLAAPTTGRNHGQRTGSGD